MKYPFIKAIFYAFLHYINNGISIYVATFAKNNI